MLRASIQTVIADELSYVTLATVHLHRDGDKQDANAIPPNSCYVCLGANRIHFFEKNLSGEWQRQLYLPYTRFALLAKL